MAPATIEEELPVDKDSPSGAYVITHLCDQMRQRSTGPLALAGLSVSANAALTASSGTLLASFDTGDRNSGSSGDYTVNAPAGAGVLHTDGLHMTGQTGASQPCRS